MNSGLAFMTELDLRITRRQAESCDFTAGVRALRLHLRRRRIRALVTFVAAALTNLLELQTHRAHGFGRNAAPEFLQHRPRAAEAD